MMKAGVNQRKLFPQKMYRFIMFQCLFVVIFKYVETYGHQYSSEICFSVLTVTSKSTTASPLECAILCDIENREAFTFNSKTGECRVVIEDIDAMPSCKTSSVVQHYKLHDICQFLPVLQGYSLEYPYYGSSIRARYHCEEIAGQQVVSSCPIVLCNDPQSLTTTPASCSVKDVFNTSLYDYEGGVSCTVRGVPCQRWDSDTPHVPNFYRGRSDLGNRCKMYSEQRPWCYTTDPKMRWDYCPVEDLDCGNPPTILTPPNMTDVKINTERPYRGSTAFAWYRCASLVTADPVSHCPLTRCDGDLTWSQANISCSLSDCYDITNQIYKGRVTCTQTGITCQRWDSQTPHDHSTLQGRSDLENWCQLVDGEARPWCYTVSPNRRWEYCTVEECP